MAGKGIEIVAERLHIDGQPGRCLAAIDQHLGLSCTLAYLSLLRRRMIIIEIFERGCAPRCAPTVPNRVDSS
jgi:hypothetical protein